MPIADNDIHMPIALFISNSRDPAFINSSKTYQGRMSFIKSFENGTIINASSSDTDSRTNHTADRAPYTVTFYEDQAWNADFEVEEQAKLHLYI